MRFDVLCVAAWDDTGSSVQCSDKLDFLGAVDISADRSDVELFLLSHKVCGEIPSERRILLFDLVGPIRWGIYPSDLHHQEIIGLAHRQTVADKANLVVEVPKGKA